MGHTLSRLLSPLIRFIWKKVSALVDVEIAGLVGSPSFWRNDLSETLLSPSFKNLKSEMTNLQMKISSYFEKTEAIREANEEKDTAATKLQKVYKSYRTRRNLADCAVVVEELWWKAQDFASLSSSSILFFRHEKPETAVSRWSRARTRAARVGKGLSKDEKAQKLALRHWLEAIDPRHRYGHNLHFYYEIWFNSESSEPFFYWLDIGGGKEVNLEKCSRSKLQHQCIRYLGPKERKAYEVIVEDGKLVYKQTLDPINSVDGSKWIFVLSTSRKLYVGQKEKGRFQHSSFLAGGATTSAGRLVAVNGVLRAIWPYSGHYLPTEENFKEFINFLTEKRVDLTNVKKYSIDEDDFISFGKRASMTEDSVSLEDLSGSRVEEAGICYDSRYVGPALGMSGPMSCQWSTGVGPRIGCVRDYPVDLQCLALEKVNLSPRTGPTLSGNNGPIPSPRPSPRLRLSPRLSHMGIPGPSTFLSQPKSKRKMENINIPSPRVSLCLHESKDAVGISGLSPGLSPYFAEAENGGDHMNFQSPMVILSLPKSRKRVGQVGIPSPRAFFSLHESRSTGDPMGIIALSPSVSPSPPKADNRGEHVNIRSPKISPT